MIWCPRTRAHLYVRTFIDNIWVPYKKNAIYDTHLTYYISRYYKNMFLFIVQKFVMLTTIVISCLVGIAASILNMGIHFGDKHENSKI